MTKNKNIYKTIGDIVTILLLTAAFSLAFYFGFIPDKTTGAPKLSALYFAVVTVGGMLLLFSVGALSSFIARNKKNALTPAFVTVFCVQTACLVGLFAISFAVYFDIFEKTTANPILRILYIIFVLVMIAGYTETVFVSEPCFASGSKDEDEEDEDDEEDDL